MPARLGVDIGGTFTDLVVIDEATGTARVGKVLTTPKDPAHGVEEGIRALLDDAGVRPDEVRAVVHGTTLATNALIEKKGAKTALLTTEGFRDALEIGREGRYDMYDLFIDPPPPLVPRHLRREVPERLLADGSIARAIDEVAARRVLAELAQDGVEALAICLLHAYVNPAHEGRLVALAREAIPGVFVSCSSEVVPEIREYERASTTCANVYVAPLMARYLEDLERRLAGPGNRADRDRRGRRVDRARGPDGPPEGRSGQRRGRPRPRLLQPRGPVPDGDGRGPPARLSRRRVLPGRAHAPGSGGRAPQRRRARGPPARSRPDRGGVGAPSPGPREHGRRRPHPRHRTRARPAPVPALRLRWRRPRPLLAGGEDPQGPAHPDPVRCRRDVGVRAPRGAARVRLRADGTGAARPRRLACDQPALRRDGGGRARAPRARGCGAG